MDGYILAHDLGTSGNKATLFDAGGRLVQSTVYSYGTLYHHDRWVEQDPAAWWDAVCATTKELLEKTGTKPGDILCVCFSAQMMGCLLVDKEGIPLRNMITWADSRASKQERWMLDRVGIERGYRITGHRLSASYSAAKLLWVKENGPELYAKAYKMIHAKDYVIFKLTGNIVTDYSDGSGTNLLDISSKTWSQELIQAFDIRGDLLPELHPSTDVAGRVTAEAARACGLARGTPVVIGDGSCACVGAGVVREGNAYNVIGTSSWISSAASAPYFDDKMRTFNWVHLDPELYTPCGTMQAAGLSYQWYKNTLCRDEEGRARAGKGGGPQHLRFDGRGRNERAAGCGRPALPALSDRRTVPPMESGCAGYLCGAESLHSKAGYDQSRTGGRRLQPAHYPGDIQQNPAAGQYHHDRRRRKGQSMAADPGGHLAENPCGAHIY